MSVRVVKVKAGLTKSWAVRGDQDKKLYRDTKRFFQTLLNPGEGRVGVCWEYPDANVSVKNMQ